jgi:hypothetical protein
MTQQNEVNTIEQAMGAVQLYSEIANLLLDILATADNASVGGVVDYELKLMCVQKLKSIVEKLDV